MPSKTDRACLAKQSSFFMIKNNYTSFKFHLCQAMIFRHEIKQRTPCVPMKQSASQLFIFCQVFLDFKLVIWDCEELGSPQIISLSSKITHLKHKTSKLWTELPSSNKALAGNNKNTSGETEQC